MCLVPTEDRRGLWISCICTYGWLRATICVILECNQGLLQEQQIALNLREALQQPCLSISKLLILYQQWLPFWFCHCSIWSFRLCTDSILTQIFSHTVNTETTRTQQITSCWLFRLALCLAFLHCDSCIPACRAWSALAICLLDLIWACILFWTWTWCFFLLKLPRQIIFPDFPSNLSKCTLIKWH